MGAVFHAEHALIAKLSVHLPVDEPLTDQEIERLLRAQSAVRTIQRGRGIILQGHRYSGIFVLTGGFSLRYKLMADGKRQVLNVSIPGDIIGYPACFFDEALYSVTAITEVTASILTFKDVAELFSSFPRLAMALFWLTANETAMFGEHLTDVGRRTAYGRVAHFILEMAVRLRTIGMGDGMTFDMPLTQDRIADAIGLSAPHINRMLRRLREDGLVEIDGTRVCIRDKESLATLADFDESYLTPRRIPSVATACPDYFSHTHNGYPAIRTVLARPLFDEITNAT